LYESNALWTTINLLAPGALIILTGEANDLTPYNAPGYVAGGPNGLGAATFDDALEQMLYHDSNESLQIGNSDVTFTAWIYPTDVAFTGHNQMVICKDNDLTAAGSEYALVGEAASGKFIFQCEFSQSGGTTVRAEILGTATLTPNAWNFVAGWFNSVTHEVVVYVNFSSGVTVASSGIYDTVNTTSTPFSIGCDYNTTNPSNALSWFDGNIQDVRLYKRVLSFGELYRIKNLYLSNIFPGTLQTGTGWSADVPAQLSSNVNSVTFTPVAASSVSFGVIPLIYPNYGGAISLWVKPNDLDGILLGNTANANVYIRLTNSTTIGVQSALGTLVNYTVPTMSTGTWYNIIIRFVGSNNVKVYLNGVESSSGSQAQSTVFVLDQIGRYWNGSAPTVNYDGKISEINIFVDPISDADVAALYAGTDLTTQIIRWKLNEGSGTAAADTGNNHSVSTANLISHWKLDETSGTRYDSWSH